MIILLTILFFFLVFTPLFFGAELHIPTSEDIGVPGKLAEWMAEHEVTITHLTPGINFHSHCQAFI